MVTKLNNSFRKFMNEIGCDGEVGLDRGEAEAEYLSVSEYGIMIKVSTRQIKPNQYNSSTRQDNTRQYKTIQ